MEGIKEYSHVASSQVDEVNILINLISCAKELFNVSKNDEKREILKILFSKQEFDGKNIVFSIRKPIEELLSMGSRQLWLTKVYDLRKKYEQELAEMYLIINGMDDDLRQMMTIEKG